MGIEQATVFGGSGFIGRYIVRELARTGAQIRVAVRRPDRAMFLKPMGDVGQITPVAVNVRDDASVAAAVAGSDLAVNLVGVLYSRGRQSFDAIHRDGAGRIARAARAAGTARLIHFSAIGANRNSRSGYGRSKAAGEAAVRQAFPEAAIVRPSIVVGPEDDFFNRFAVYARFSPVLPLIGGGETRFQPVYVGDLADAVAAIATRPDTDGMTFEIGGPRVYTFKELLELLLSEIGRHRLLLPVPFALAELKAFFLEWLPVPPLTRDQVRMLQTDNVVAPDMPGLADLGVEPTAIETILAGYLRRYRPASRRSIPA